MQRFLEVGLGVGSRVGHGGQVRCHREDRGDLLTHSVVRGALLLHHVEGGKATTPMGTNDSDDGDDESDDSKYYCFR